VGKAPSLPSSGQAVDEENDTGIGARISTKGGGGGNLCLVIPLGVTPGKAEKRRSTKPGTYMKTLLERGRRGLPKGGGGLTHQQEESHPKGKGGVEPLSQRC